LFSILVIKTGGHASSQACDWQVNDMTSWHHVPGWALLRSWGIVTWTAAVASLCAFIFTYAYVHTEPSLRWLKFGLRRLRLIAKC